jgi:very-short-patch-repair endonuclease
MGVRVVAWKRYGHCRTYVNDDDGTPLGYRDDKSGEMHVLVESRTDDVRDALAARSVSTAPPAPRAEPDPGRQAAARKGLATRSRNAPTLSEKTLADELLRSSPFVWEREVPWDAYRLDFYCAAARLAVEVDGSSHRKKAAADAARDAFFRAAGVETLRVSAYDVERDPAVVVAAINRACIGRTGAVPPTTAPAPGLLGRLLGRTVPVARPVMAPPEYTGRRRGGAFVCARCRTERAAAERSRRATSCCTGCAG